MSTPVEQMLLSALSQHANYAEKQLIKTGELGKCAARIIKRRRMALLLFYGVFIGLLAIPLVAEIAERILSPDRATGPDSVPTYCLIAMMQLPHIIFVHISLSRLETIVSIWLLSSTEDSGKATNDTDAQLSELLASGA